MVHARLCNGFLGQLQTHVVGLRANAQTPRKILHRIQANRDLMHHITPEIIALVAGPHVDLLALQLGGEAATDPGTLHTPSLTKNLHF